MTSMILPPGVFYTYMPRPVRNVLMSLTIVGTSEILSWGDGVKDCNIYLIPFTSFTRIPVTSATEYSSPRVFKVHTSYMVSGSETVVETPLVFKVAAGNSALKRLEHEADIYASKLKDLQGKVVPRYFGMYKGRSDYGNVGVMVLEHCGEALSQELNQCDPHVR